MALNGKRVWIPARVVLALLCATGVMELYMSRINLSIAIVAMVQTVRSNSTAGEAPRLPFCLRGTGPVLFRNQSEHLNNTVELEYKVINPEEQSSERHVPSIRLTTAERGNVLSAFFYSYWLTAILGGRLAELYGTKIVFGVGVLIDCLGNLLIPVASKKDVKLLFLIRFMMGLFQGACYPALNPLIARWIPPNETSRFFSFVFTASSLGTVFTLAICGVIINELGWEWVFYMSSAISIIWIIIWILLMHDNPNDHPRISEKEKRYIQESKKTVNSSQRKAESIPWKEMLLSRPLWAIASAHSANMFGLSFFVTQLPIYLSSIIGTQIKNNGILSSLPFIARYLSSNFFGWFSAFMMMKVSLKPKTWKIILSIIGFAGPGVAVVMVGYAGCNSLAALSFFIVGLSLSGANASGYTTNIVEITPHFSGTALGLCSTIGFCYAMIIPVMTGALTPKETLGEWIVIYWICFANFIIGGGIYSIFLETDVQNWNYKPEAIEVIDEHSKYPRNSVNQEEIELHTQGL